MRFLLVVISILISIPAYNQDETNFLLDGEFQLVDADGDFITFVPQRMFSLNITGSTGSFYLRASETADVQIYWGDGTYTEETVTTSRSPYSHTYDGIGFYDIYMTGELSKIVEFDDITKFSGSVSDNFLKLTNLEELKIYNPTSEKEGFFPVDFDSIQYLYINNLFNSGKSYLVDFDDLVGKENLYHLFINGDYFSTSSFQNYGDATSALDNQSLSYVQLSNMPGLEVSIDSLYKNDSIHTLNMRYANEATGTIDSRFNDVMSKITYVDFARSEITGGIYTYCENLTRFYAPNSNSFNIDYDSLANGVITILLPHPLNTGEGSIKSFVGDKSFSGNYFYMYECDPGTIDSVYDWNVSNRIVIDTDSVTGDLSVFSNTGLQSISQYIHLLCPVKGNVNVFRGVPTFDIRITSDSITNGLSELGYNSSLTRFEMQCDFSTSELDGYLDSLMHYRNDYNLLVNKTIDISNNGGTPSGTYQEGDLGTYAGSVHDLTETQIDNLVAGDDYDGGGTNTAWTPLEIAWALVNIKENSGSTTSRYKFTITY